MSAILDLKKQIKDVVIDFETISSGLGKWNNGSGFLIPDPISLRVEAKKRTADIDIERVKKACEELRAKSFQHVGCNYETAVRDPAILKRVVDILLPVLKKHIDDFDGFVVSGYSMSLISPILAFMLDKHIAVVRKDDNDHSGHRVEGLTYQRWVMVDDLVSSGSTLGRIYSGLKKISGELVGICLYNHEFYVGEFQKTFTEPITGVTKEVPCWISFKSFHLSAVPWTKEQIVEEMNSATNDAEWSLAKENVLKHNGVLPDYWKELFVDSGLEARICGF